MKWETLLCMLYLHIGDAAQKKMWSRQSKSVQNTCEPREQRELGTKG